MKYYMAPLEGITTYIFRQVYNRHFEHFDKYFTPFLASTKLTSREKQEILPENNQGIILVPQILANNPDTFLGIARQLADYGYRTVNLNLGCPSGTVVAKKRGAGQLGDICRLRDFLDEVFEKCPLTISVKTRIGLESMEEWDALVELYSNYKLEELIIHPRLREEYYSGKPHVDAVSKALKHGLGYPVCYNGDILSKDDQQRVVDFLPDIPDYNIMIGRGVLRNPFLLSQIKGLDSHDDSDSESLIRDFLIDLAESYAKAYGKGQDRNVLFKQKDIWNYLGLEVEDHDKEIKMIRKTESVAEYCSLVKRIYHG